MYTNARRAYTHSITHTHTRTLYGLHACVRINSGYYANIAYDYGDWLIN